MVLVIDARGTELTPCLFPQIVTPDGAVLYDNRTIEHEAGVSVPPPVQYVETDLTFEKIEARLEAEDDPFKPERGSPRQIHARRVSG